MADRVLFLGQFPPPVHGVSMINSWIRSSGRINTSLRIRYVDISTSRSLSELESRGVKKIWRSLTIILKVIFELVFFRFDKAYITLSPIPPGFYKDAFLVFLLKLWGVRNIVIHLHGKGIDSFLESNPKAIWRYNQVFKNTHVIHLSDSLLGDIAKIGSVQKVSILNNGIPLKGFKETQDKIHTNRILYLSNLIPSKGAFTLLEACKELKARNTDFHVTFIGRWSSKEFRLKCESYIKENKLEKQIDFVGGVYGSAKEAYLSEANIFVLPSWYPNECFPLSILEAFKYGLPVVSTFEGAIPDIIKDGETGYLVQSKDSLVLAKRLDHLLGDSKLLTEMGYRAQCTFKEKYDFKHFENGFIRILNEQV